LFGMFDVLCRSECQPQKLRRLLVRLLSWWKDSCLGGRQCRMSVHVCMQ
jgi:hypothetical protein